MTRPACGCLIKKLCGGAQKFLRLTLAYQTTTFEFRSRRCENNVETTGGVERTQFESGAAQVERDCSRWIAHVQMRARYFLMVLTRYPVLLTISLNFCSIADQMQSK